MDGHKLNLLSLDGGGVRGLSSLYILKRLMEAVDRDNPPKPCDYFDMIGGTSTGGLIAILLGRLKLDVQQCIDTYRNPSSQAFKRKRNIPIGPLGSIRARFDSKALEEAVKSVLVEQGHSEDLLLKDTYHTCRVFVCATSEGSSAIVPLRSYPSERASSELHNITRVWEAARATSAATTFFDPITIGPSKQRFVDGATGANNPVRQLWQEVQDVWPGPAEQKIGCVVSIGTGVPSVKKFGKDALGVFESLKKIALETESTARSFHQEHTDLDDTNRYFRFNVPDGLAEIGLENIDEISTIAAATDHYLAGEGVYKRIKICAKSLKEREACRSVVAKQSLPQDDPSRFIELSQRPEWVMVQEDSPYNIFEEISDYEADRTCRNYLRDRCPGTTSWVLDDDRFREWAENRGPSCLWLTGKIGSGKSIVTSTIVQHMTSGLEGAGGFVGHFFYSHSNGSQLQATHPFASYVKQMLGFIHAQEKCCPQGITASLKRFYGPKRLRPSFRELVDDIFAPLSEFLTELSFTATYILDGLDECEFGEDGKILNAIYKLLSQHKPLKFLVAGREGLNLTNVIPGSLAIHISDGSNAGDIRKLIEWKIANKMRERQLTEDDAVLNAIEKELNEKADRMILWVKLQIEALWEECFTDADIQEALANLPKDLTETYERCLVRINKQQSRFAEKILRWLLCTTVRPFKINQLREALAIDSDTGQFQRGRMPPEQVVLKSCSNLITRTDSGEVVLTHHSIRQFLIDRLDAPSPAIPAMSAIEAAELELGCLCVTHLTSPDYSLTVQHINTSEPLKVQIHSQPFQELSKSLPSWTSIFLPTPKPTSLAVSLPGFQKDEGRSFNGAPFLCFARENWAPLTRSITAESCYWEKFCSLALTPTSSWRFHPWPPIGQSLDSHYTGMLGWSIANRHLPLIRLLFTAEPQPRPGIFNLPLPAYGNLPPLHLASSKGDDVVVHLLLPRCDLKQKDIYGKTALHYAASSALPSIKALVTDAEMIDLKDSHDESPFDTALRSKHKATIQTLAKLVEQDFDDRTIFLSGSRSHGSLLFSGTHFVSINKPGGKILGKFKIYIFEMISVVCFEKPKNIHLMPTLRSICEIRRDCVVNISMLIKTNSFGCEVSISWRDEIGVGTISIEVSDESSTYRWLAATDRLAMLIKTQKSPQMVTATVHYKLFTIEFTMHHLISYRKLIRLVDSQLAVVSSESLRSGKLGLEFQGDSSWKFPIKTDLDVRLAFQTRKSETLRFCIYELET